MRLLAHPNALVTGHQDFLTHDALTNIATTSLETLAWGQPRDRVAVQGALRPRNIRV